MAGKDASEKILLAHNDVFADVVNALLFKGDSRVKAGELVDAQPTSVFKVAGELRGQERDVMKFWKKQKMCISLFGLENQTEIDRTMPLRVIGYDGAAYRAQLLDKGRTQLYPVITLVLYLGHKHRWKKPRSLCETISVPDELKPFMSDYKINVFEIAFLEKDAIMRFKSDFKFLADYLYQMRTTRGYRPSKDEIIHVEEVMQMMSAMTGDDRFTKTYNEQKGNGTRRVKTMLDWLDKAINNGRNEGIAIGVAEGEERKALEDARNFKRLGVSEKIIAEATGLSLDEVAAL